MKKKLTKLTVKSFITLMPAKSQNQIAGGAVQVKATENVVACTNNPYKVCINWEGMRICM